MRTLRVLGVSLLLFFSASSFGSSGSGLLPNGRLDLKSLRQAYIEAEFDFMKDVLETRLKQQAGPLTAEERIFTYKHLGVVYAAEPQTRSKSESYFYQLLKIAPDIEIIDMYASPSIEKIFREVKEDFQKRSKYTRDYDNLGRPITPAITPSLPAPANREEPSSKPRNKGTSWIWWSAAGFATVTAAVVAILILREDEPQENVIGSGS